KRVQAAIDRTGYRPQLAAQQLRTGTSGIVTLAVPSLTFSYFSDIAQHFIDQAQERGRTVVLHSTSAGREQEVEVLEGFKRRLGDGVIFNPLLLEEQYFSTKEELPQPTVLIGEHVPDRDLPAGSDYLRIDNTRATTAATDPPLATGRRAFPYIGALPTAPTVHPHGSAPLRIDGFRQSLTRHGMIPYRAPLQQVDNWHRHDGRSAAPVLLDGHPDADAIASADGELALGGAAGLR